MNAELAFKCANYFALIGWALLAFAPRWRWTARVVHTGAISLILAAAYLVLASLYLFSGDGGMGSLAQLAKAFQNPNIVLVGWIHYLAFDLFIGAWEARDAARLKIPHLALVPCLLLTLMLGPVGLLAYCALRGALRRRFTLDEI